MKIIDSHAHLDMSDFREDRAQVLERAREGGISHIISVGIDLSSSLAALELSREYDFVFSSIGYHPHHADDMGPEEEKALSRMALDPEVVAWGEIGLDFFHRHSSPQKQMEVFKKQIELASDAGLPIIIHDRDAHREVLDILKATGNKEFRGVIHCFSGDYALAMTFIEMGFYLSIPGTVTYKGARQVKDVAAKIPLERMLAETDAPFLTPVPFRGKRNESAFVIHTVREIARLRRVSIEEVAIQTSKNTRKLFNLPVNP